MFNSPKSLFKMFFNVMLLLCFVAVMKNGVVPSTAKKLESTTTSPDEKQVVISFEDKEHHPKVEAKYDTNQLFPPMIPPLPPIPFPRPSFPLPSPSVPGLPLPPPSIPGLPRPSPSVPGLPLPGPSIPFPPIPPVAIPGLPAPSPPA